MRRVVALGGALLVVALLIVLSARPDDYRVATEPGPRAPALRPVGRQGLPDTPTPQPAPSGSPSAPSVTTSPTAEPSRPRPPTNRPLAGRGRSTGQPTTSRSPDRSNVAPGLIIAPLGARPPSKGDDRAPDLPPGGVGGTGTPSAPPAPARDQVNCPNLGLVAIGDATGSPPVAAAASARFRVMATSELTRPDLVCARPITTWRDDLVAQELIVAGRPDGALLSGRSAQDLVVRLTAVEWQSFSQFRDSNEGHNFLGVPTGRTSLDGYPIIRTSRGGLVMVRADSFGLGVVNGAWDVWLARGGPSGDMGLPMARPAGDNDGAHQDFATGYVLVPGMTTDYQTEAQPASRYEWHPIPVEQRRAALPPANSVVDVEGASYYVDAAGTRHWIASTSDWQCATSDLHARSTTARGYVAAEIPLGPQFSCPTMLAAGRALGG